MSKAEKILEAEKEIRKEGAKAAFLHAAIETTLFFVAVFFLISALAPAWIPAEIGPVSGEIVVAAVAGAVFFLGDAALVYRSRTLEYFEEANPQVNEALRTARDAAKAGEENPMAEALYDDVLDELQTTSSEGFVSVPRIAGSVAIVALAGFLLLAVSFGGYGTGFGFGGEDGALSGFGDSEGVGEGGGGGGEGEESEDIVDDDEGDLDEVLGEQQDLERGGEDIGIEIGSGGAGGEGDGGTTTGPSRQEYDADVEVDTGRAEYSPEEEIDDAELVKEYNLRVRGEE